MSEDFSRKVPQRAQSAPPRKKRHETRMLSGLMTMTLESVFVKRGFPAPEIVMRWAEIVGADLAAQTRPIAIRAVRGGSGEIPEKALHIACAQPFALVLHQRAPTVIARANFFSGCGAIQRISVSSERTSQFFPQFSEEPRKATSAPPSPEAESILADMADSPLRVALSRLGNGVFRNR